MNNRLLYFYDLYAKQINNGDSGQIPFDWGNAHAYPNTWDSFGSPRVFRAGPGSVTVGFWHRCGSTGWINGASLQGFWTLVQP